MNRDCGRKQSEIWLIGDSEPRNFSGNLKNPLDYKHPTIHNIFTPIINEIQEEVFKIDNRIDRNKFYIRNAIKDSCDWDNNDKLNEEVKEFSHLIKKYKPLIIISFGRRAFEFVRRANCEEEKKLTSWTTYKIGQEFIKRYKNFEPKNINIIPLLHVSIARGKFLEAHKYFCKAINEELNGNEENYFVATGNILGKLLVDHKEIINCWERPINNNSKDNLD
ncbi:hypothetical protein CBU02nite_28390 [Clostridium butyricum]|uniref:Uracil-DNA glycosylase-like domain-containing protein n=1 Tax=Clostridium butyricum TaxID=1492 RepID=A0A512TQG6_CLOBU|nr:hypothetical protein [Clostridium butyricum]NOW21841.1 hypothetical protein [Clostridium butyricum]GEQ22333.1 hypothetical protein CBU02nite_28390 [Clostridium butyricum]